MVSRGLIAGLILALFYTTHPLAQDSQQDAVPSAEQASVGDIEQEGLERIAEGQKAQQGIDSVHSDSRSLLDEYHSRLKLVEGLRQYNAMLLKQLENQDQEISTLQESNGNVAVVERQILPLMVSMIDGLEQFVELDVPFLLEERRKRVTTLRGLMSRSDVTVAEKVRRVFEAYQIENDYGRTIEAYKAKLDLGEGSFDADFLRIGRSGLMYRTVGNAEVGFWDAQQGGWSPLQGVPYRRYIEQGLKVANQEVAPELISIPLNPALEVQR
jgi:hypothetical protein